MSVRVMTLVWDAPFPSIAAKIIALKLADCANDEGHNVYPSRATIERATMSGESTVKKWLTHFERAGLLLLVDGRRSAGGRWQSTTRRQFNMPVLRGLAAGTHRFEAHTDDDGQTGWRITAHNDATGPRNGPGHQIAPATSDPKGGHGIARRGPPNGPNPLRNRHRTVSAPGGARAKGARAPDAPKPIRLTPETTPAEWEAWHSYNARRFGASAAKFMSRLGVYEAASQWPPDGEVAA